VTRRNEPQPEAEIARAEECCLDAEAWAGELEDWLRTHPKDARESEMTSIAQLLRALVKSIRLSIVADENDENRGYLVEELESTMASARAIAAGVGAHAPVERRVPSIQPPPILGGGRDGVRTKPPPPGQAPKDILGRNPISDLPVPRKPPTRKE
jgi:hypothetical protein